MTLIPRPEEPAVLGRCCHNDGTNDPAVQRLWDLIAGGVDQWTASLRVFGGAR